ncbi:phosphopantetheine-binding protein [Streptomyces sp. NPDC058657]|uniref:phosphopantetheine-binding protein n=1 Tax=unclassified Streptomyces TaxID=2593676 RepID=UPI00364F69B0
MTVTDTLRTILVNDLNVDQSAAEIAGDTSIRDELGVDSLGFEELRVRVEEEFKIHIGEDDFSPETFASIDTLTELVARLQDSAPATAPQGKR